MRKLLLITGDLAVGKSRFAEILSNRYGIAVMYKDRVKELLCDSIGFADREENKRLSVVAVELMAHYFTSMTVSGSDIILEANFRENELKKIYKIAVQKEYEVLCLVLRADMDIIYKRFVNRIENENRHPAHISGFDGYDTLKYYIDEGRKQAIPGKSLEINANDFSYQCDDKILSQIDEFLGIGYENN